MKRLLLFSLIILVSALARGQSLELIMDMVHNNPGEKPYETKYNSPTYLKLEGFTGMTSQWYINCLITYDNYEKGIVPETSEVRELIETMAADVDKKLAECKKAGINVYPFTDFIVFPSLIWDKYGDSNKRNSKGVGSAIGRQIEEALSKELSVKASAALNAIRVSCVYGRIKYELIEQIETNKIKR